MLACEMRQTGLVPRVPFDLEKYPEEDCRIDCRVLSADLKSLLPPGDIPRALE